MNAYLAIQNILGEDYSRTGLEGTLLADVWILDFSQFDRIGKRRWPP